MLQSRALAAILMLAGVPAHAMTIQAGNLAENGAAIAVEFKPDRPLTAGQRLDVLVNGELATQVRIVSGTVTTFSTRVKGPQGNTTVTGRVVANGSVLDSGSRNIRVIGPVPSSGPATAPASVRVRNLQGRVAVLLSSENGFSGTVVFQGSNFRAEVTGSPLLSKDPLFQIRGEFTGQIAASHSEQGGSTTVDSREGNRGAAQTREDARPPESQAHQAEIDRQNAIAEQERKEARRRDRRESLAFLRNYTKTSASAGNEKPANRLARIEALTKKPEEGDNRVSRALNTYSDRVNRNYPNAAAPGGAVPYPGGTNGNNSAPTSGPGPAIASNPTATYPSHNTGGSRSSSSRLTPQQIRACSEEIKRTQIESQKWRGDIQETSVRLGRYQKELFEGRCAGHPEAEAYIRGAKRMIERQEASATGQGRRRKVHNPANDARSCTQLIQDTSRQGADISGRWRFVNNCPTAVEFFWCSDQECERGSGNTWTIGSGRGWPVSGQNVRWGACRGANSGGHVDGSKGTSYICHLLKW